MNNIADTDMMDIDKEIISPPNDHSTSHENLTSDAVNIVNIQKESDDFEEEDLFVDPNEVIEEILDQYKKNQQLVDWKIFYKGKRDDVSWKDGMSLNEHISKLSKAI